MDKKYGEYAVEASSDNWKTYFEKHEKKLFQIHTTKDDWKRYSLWGRCGMRVGQVIGLIEIKITI